MAYNVPTVDTTDISFGPGVVYMNPSSAFKNVAGAGGLDAPTAEVGSITEDGVSFEFQRESKMISQGNPRIPIMYFDQAHGFTCSFTGIEWNMTTLSRMLGSGTVTTGGADPVDSFKWGGDPLPDSFGILIKHKSAMLEASTTYSGTPFINIKIWKAYPSENLAITLGQDEHQFPASYQACRETKSWDDTVTLLDGQQLIQIDWAAAS